MESTPEEKQKMALNAAENQKANEEDLDGVTGLLVQSIQNCSQETQSEVANELEKSLGDTYGN